MFRKMLPLGEENARSGYQEIIDTYREAKEWPQATAAAKEAVQKLPNDREMRMVLNAQTAVALPYRTGNYVPGTGPTNFFDISSNAVFSGNLTVCFKVPGVTFSMNPLMPTYTAAATGASANTNRHLPSAWA